MQAKAHATDYRRALAQFATGVTVVTTRDTQGHPVGLTVNSFNSVSLEPPLVLWSLALKASSVPAFETCSHYAVNVLAGHQLEAKSSAPWATLRRAAWARPGTSPG